MVERLASRVDAPKLAAHEMIQGSLPVGRPEIDELHELRVRIPMDLHRQLLSLKVLRGKSLAETVSTALENYFAQVKAPPRSDGKDATGRPL